MAVNENLTAYSRTAANNTPAGSDAIGTDLDDNLRDMKKNILYASQRPVTEKSGTYSATLEDHTKILLVDASAGAATIVLPAAATAGDGYRLAVKKNDSTTNAVTIDGDAAETIDGSTTYALNFQHDWVDVHCDGSKWLLANKKQSIGKGLTGTSTLQLQVDSLDTTSASASDTMNVVIHDGAKSSLITRGNFLQGQGACVQEVHTEYAAVATGTTLMPVDDTIPQNTEGDEYMTQAITPKSTTNRLVIEGEALVTSSAINTLSMGLFQDSTANAIYAAGVVVRTAGDTFIISFRHEMAAGTTSSTTFKVRVGGNNAGTTTFNGSGGARRYGAIPKSTITIREYKA